MSVAKRQPHIFPLFGYIMQQSTPIDYEARFNELQSRLSGNQTFEDCFVEEGHLLIRGEGYDNWGNYKIDAYMPKNQAALHIVAGKMELTPPVFYHDDNREKVDFVNSINSMAYEMKKKGNHVGSAMQKYGCPCCGTKQYPEMDGESEGDGCAADWACLLYTSPSPRDRTRSRMPSSA